MLDNTGYSKQAKARHILRFWMMTTLGFRISKKPNLQKWLKVELNGLLVMQYTLSKVHADAEKVHIIRGTLKTKMPLEYLMATDLQIY